MRFLTATLAALALSAPLAASAADLPVKAQPVPPPVVVYNWTGFYIGANGGYSWGRDPYDLAGASTTRTRVFRAFGLPAETLVSDVTAPGVAFAGSGTANIDGGVAGGQIGYNWQIDRTWVVGLETDIQWSGQRGSVAFCLTVGCPAGTFGVTADYGLRWFGTFRARAGVLVDPRVLLYVTGGLAYGEVKADYTSGIFGAPLALLSTSTTRAGWTVGAGVEGAFWNNWSLKAEYLYVDLGTVSSGALAAATSTVITPNVPGQGFTTVTDTTLAAASSLRVRDNIFRVGLNYRFDAGPVVARY
jgi:outer membrane immunogenic protein